MRCLRRALLAGFVWLTALSTLLAGAPHCRCVCPDGRIKPFCLALPMKFTGCCTSDACCLRTSESRPVKPVKAGSCCCQKAKARPGPVGVRLGNTGRVENSGCKRALTDAAPADVTARQEIAPDALAAGLLVAPPSPGLPPRGPGAGRQPSSWQNHCLPPPTDLVVILQHFLI
jgi:hypothetical protein